MDVISDPLMGWISDTTVKRFGIHGRRKPYMFWGPFLYGIGSRQILIPIALTISFCVIHITRVHFYIMRYCIMST